MITLTEKKLMLITMGRAEQELSKITLKYSIYYQESYPIKHLLSSIGFLRDSISSLNEEIIKESKNG